MGERLSAEPTGLVLHREHRSLRTTRPPGPQALATVATGSASSWGSLLSLSRNGVPGSSTIESSSTTSDGASRGRPLSRRCAPLRLHNSQESWLQATLRGVGAGARRIALMEATPAPAKKIRVGDVINEAFSVYGQNFGTLIGS